MLGRLLSNRARPWTALACVAWLGVMAGLYGHYSVTKPVGYRYCLDHVEECRDRTILLPLWRVSAVHADGYELTKIVGPLPVRAEPGDLAVGQTVSLVTTFDAEALELVEVERQVHHLRTAKVVLGLIGLVLTGLLVLLGFRWRDRGVVALG